MRRLTFLALTVMALALLAQSAAADGFFFSTGNPDGKMATASRPDSAGGKFEIESADDFALTSPTTITSATFTGLLTAGATPSNVVVEIYRVFPADSTFPPSGKVPTRVNSPSDNAFDTRSSVGGQLSFSTSTLAGSFTANNSVIANGIIVAPPGTTGGNGPLTGQEVQFTVTFTTPFSLPADHYFFVPQVQVNGGGDFFWLSAPRPIVPPGTPFPAGFTDLQEWTRDAFLDPDWLRVGTDIVGGAPRPPSMLSFPLPERLCHSLAQCSSLVPASWAWRGWAGGSVEKVN